MSEQKAHSKLVPPLAFHSTSLSTFDLPFILFSLPSKLSDPYRDTGRYILPDKWFEIRNFDFKKYEISNFVGTLKCF